MRVHLTLLWSMSLWNADVSGRPSFPDPDATRDQTQALGKKVCAAARPWPSVCLIQSLMFLWPTSSLINQR